MATGFGDDWLLRVTNFAINCRFLENALAAKNAEELKTSISSEHFYYLCCLHDDSRPKLERPDSLVSETTYRKEYWETVREMLPDVAVALQVVRDVLWFYGARYDSEQKSFVFPKEGPLLPNLFGPEFMLLDAMFDFPNFRPYRYAYKIVTACMGITTVERNVDDGEISYSIRFKVVPEAAESGPRSINIEPHVMNDMAAAGRSSL